MTKAYAWLLFRLSRAVAPSDREHIKGLQSAGERGLQRRQALTSTHPAAAAVLNQPRCDPSGGLDSSFVAVAPDAAAATVSQRLGSPQRRRPSPCGIAEPTAGNE